MSGQFGLLKQKRFGPFFATPPVVEHFELLAKSA